MAEIAPFRALRYNPRLVPDLRAVVTPPYDIISPEAQAGYYARDPYNVVRLVLAQHNAPETPGLDRYQAAARTYAAWRREGVLIRDAEPGIYVYEQAFTVAGHSYRRRGILALLKLAEYGEGVVFPHERTFPRHKDDRLQLMRACPAHLESILAFYPSQTRSLSALLDQCMQNDPLARVVDDGTAHQLWSMSDAASVAVAVQALKDQPVIIADGHHRYETALNFRNERTRTDLARGPEQFVLVHLVAVTDPGLLILPTHRLVRGPIPLDIEARLGQGFAVECFAARDAAHLRGMLAESRGTQGVSFLMYIGKGATLRLRGTGGPNADSIGSAMWPDADVLHRQIFGECLDLGPEPDRIAYTHSEAEAIAAVDAGSASLACLMTPPSVAQVQAVALSGGRMPQKSTYFYPKVMSGLVLHPIEEGERVPVP